MKTLFAAAAAMMICTGSALAAVQDCYYFSAELPDGWTFKRAPGLAGFMSVFDPTEEHAINIRVEEDRRESPDVILREGSDEKVEMHDGIAVSRGRWGVRIAAKGENGAYLEIDVNTPLLKDAPAFIRSMNADEGFPPLRPAIEKLGSEKALEFLK